MSEVIYTFALPSITCISCVQSIETILKTFQQNHPWLRTFTIDLMSKRLNVSLEHEEAFNIQSLSKEIEDSGFRCVPLTTQDLFLNKPASTTEETSFLKSHWFQGILGTLSGFGLLIGSIVTGGFPLPVLLAIGFFCISVTIWLGFSSYKDAFLKLWKAKTLTMDTLFSLSTLTVMIVSTLAFFLPGLPMMFEAGLLVFGFRHIGLAIEASLRHQLKADKRFQHRLPKKVRLYINDQLTEPVSLLSLSQDDLLIIHPGELIPVDGVCLTPSCLIYETIKTGSPLPRVFKSGERLISGMRLANDSCPIQLKVTTDVHHSYLARLDNTIESAAMEKAPIEEVANRILQYFIPGVIILALLSGLTLGMFFPAALAIKCAISVLVSACPCTLGLVVPLAVKIGLQKGAMHGVEFKSAKKIQDAATVDAIVFDLHGTLTMGSPEVISFNLCSTRIPKETLIAYAATLEQNSQHPMGKAICEFAQSKQMKFFNKNVVAENTSHSGIQGKIDGHAMIIGNEKMMAESNIDTTDVKENLMLNAGETVVYLAVDNHLVGYFILKDPLRPEALQTINTLKQLGKQVYICTGADQQTANGYAKILGIPKSNVAANQVGMKEHNQDQSKMAFIKGLQAKGLKVAMLGDADNDALALTTSDFGIAIESNASSDITQQQAGAIIRSHSLLPVANLFTLADQTVSTIKQNLGFSLGYNTMALFISAGLLVVLGITLNPAIGVALMILQTTLILGNTYRFKNMQINESEEKAMEGDSYQTFHTNLQLQKPQPVIAAQAGIHGQDSPVRCRSMGPRLCGDDISTRNHHAHV